VIGNDVNVVAMTLVVTTLLPSIQAHKGSVLDSCPICRGTRHHRAHLCYLRQILGVAAATAGGDRHGHVTPSLVPISTSLPGLAGSSAIQGSVMIYGAHLTLIALVNLLLWIEVHRSVVARLQIVRASPALILFVAALGVGAMRPALALISGLQSSLHLDPVTTSHGICRGQDDEATFVPRHPSPPIFKQSGGRAYVECGP